MTDDTIGGFVKRFFGFSLGPIISAFLGFIITPITTWLILPEEFGKAAMFTMAYSLTSLFLLMGTDQAFIREFNSSKNKVSLFWNSFIIPFIFSILISIIYLIYGESISIVLFDSYEKFIVFMLSVFLPISVLHRFNILLIRMEEKAKLYSFLVVFEKIINLPFLLLLLFLFERSFKSIVLAHLISILVVSLVLLYLNRVYWITKIELNKTLILRILKYALPLIPASIFAWLLNSMDKMALRAWSDFYEIGIYSVAFRIVMVLEIVKKSFSTFWSPTQYRWYESNVPNERFIKVSHILSLGLFLLFSFIVLFKELFVLILNETYREALNLIPFLLFMPMMYTITETTKSGINFSRRTWYNAIVTFVAGVINFSGNYVLVPLYGGLGASISTGVSFIIYFWLATLISRHFWFKFELKFYIINISLLIVQSITAVFFDCKILEVIIIMIVVSYNFKLIKYLAYLLSGYFKTYIKH